VTGKTKGKHMKRLCLAAAAAIVLSASAPSLQPASAQQAQPMTLRVMGMPLATGNIQSRREQPFFEGLAQRTNGLLAADYRPLDATGVREFEQLRVMRSGLFDIIGLRLGQVSRDEPTILGLDLVGLNTDYDTARRVVDAWFPAVDARLQRQFNAKLLGIWPFGPQLIFCKPAIRSLADLRGQKVRILDGVMAQFMQRIGATPVTMAFSEVSQGLSLGTIDCAVTGPSSANSAGWPESTTHVYPLALQVAVQGYAVSMATWNRMTPAQREALQSAITALTNDIWTYSKELWDDAMRCNAGQDPCTTGRKYRLTTSPVQQQDIELVRSAVREISFPAWGPSCDQVNTGCSAEWRRLVGPIIGMQ
jgi:TRAP-type C4-dicarboxylate transport system substrate-binding protein